MPSTKTINSAANPLVKDVRRAVQRGSLTAEGYCLAETFHLLEEALASDCEVHAVLVAQSAECTAAPYLRTRRLPSRDREGVVRPRVMMLPDRIFDQLAATESSQGVIALVRPPSWTIEQLFGAHPLVVVLDRVQDPGNAGAIVRAAEAFGATGVLFLKGTVSPFNPKTVRASAGSLFRIPFVHGVDAAPACAVLAHHLLDLYAAVPSHAGKTRTPADVELRRNCALIIGNEARGVSPELRAAARDLSIPTGRVESLNAAVAAGILLYEAWRQRSLGT
jgi:RNA methyltransferase, TrmH family